MTGRSFGPCRDPECPDIECVIECACERGTYPSCTYRSCYECFLDRSADYITCVFCGAWHSPEFDTCFKCRPRTRGRDDPAAALRQLILWRDNVICRYCGIREGELQADPRLVKTACPLRCHAPHRHRMPCPPKCRDEHKHRKPGDPGVCERPCAAEHKHRLLDDDGVRRAKIHVDHIVPCRRGGTADEWNLQALCGVCNIGKGSEWWPGCRHDKARTDLCRSYFILGKGYFGDEEWARFYAEVKSYRATGTWDPATHQDWRRIAA